jgi:TPR repeat protein
MTCRLTVLAIAVTAICADAAAQTRTAPVALKVDPAVLYEQAYKFDSGDGVPRDSVKAVAMYRQAADLGHTDAMLRLGYLYENGKAVPLDHAQAAEWYRRAGDLGQSRAMFMLGVCYWAGRGVPQDQIEAHRWINLAATYAVGRDQDTAVNARTALERVMTPDQIEDAKKRAREWQTALDKRKGQ